MSQRNEAQCTSVDGIALILKNSMLQLEGLKENFGGVQADIVRWKESEKRFIDEDFMEIKIPKTRNLVLVISTSENPPYENVNLFSKETSEIQPIPPVRLNPFIPEISDPAIRITAKLYSFVQAPSDSRPGHSDSTI